MTRSLAAHTLSLVLAVLATLATLAGTNALAGHQYRIAAAASRGEAVALATRPVAVVGHRLANG